ncbi:hypothetical protein NGRA_2452 [Nosema granulosis]|uniref:Uncharacterized protein n=1 Tax=Nosema granulosis TaxID=83296 RepID=A0A9P6GXN0_9MICR|nr:hypothetical protein NGRA_2452 [Nosema granulosis]
MSKNDFSSEIPVKKIKELASEQNLLIVNEPLNHSFTHQKQKKSVWNYSFFKKYKRSKHLELFKFHDVRDEIILDIKENIVLKSRTNTPFEAHAPSLLEFNIQKSLCESLKYVLVNIINLFLEDNILIKSHAEILLPKDENKINFDVIDNTMIIICEPISTLQPSGIVYDVSFLKNCFIKTPF